MEVYTFFLLIGTAEIIRPVPDEHLLKTVAHASYLYTMLGKATD